MIPWNKEDIEKVWFICQFENCEGDCENSDLAFRDMRTIANDLLRQRDAYREVAIGLSHHKFGLTSAKAIDAEAQRLYSENSSKGTGEKK